MKKSAQVTLTVVATIGMAACSRQRVDPCQPQAFNDQACQDAVHSGGYYWRGTWFPMTYGYPYPYYYDSYRRYTSTGGAVTTLPAGSYARPGGGGSGAAGVERGGFGATGHGGDEGAGE